jgi:hypothetical protein
VQIFAVVVTEVVKPRMLFEKLFVCHLFCSDVSTLAFGALCNLCVFTVKTLVYSIFTSEGRLVVVDVTPSLSMAFTLHDQPTAGAGWTSGGPDGENNPDAEAAAAAQEWGLQCEPLSTEFSELTPSREVGTGTAA